MTTEGTPKSPDGAPTSISRAPSRRSSASSSLAHWLAFGQGIYFGLTGLWPLLHMPSFLAVTGPKVDLWLVRTVGVLILAIGATLCSAGWRRRVTMEIAVLAVGSAVGLAAIDCFYVFVGRIPPIYLADAAAEALLIAAWLWIGWRTRRLRSQSGAPEVGPPTSGPAS